MQFDLVKGKIIASDESAYYQADLRWRDGQGKERRTKRSTRIPVWTRETSSKQINKEKAELMLSALIAEKEAELISKLTSKPEPKPSAKLEIKPETKLEIKLNPELKPTEPRAEAPGDERREWAYELQLSADDLVKEIIELTKKYFGVTRNVSGLLVKGYIAAAYGANKDKVDKLYLRVKRIGDLTDVKDARDAFEKGIVKAIAGCSFKSFKPLMSRVLNKLGVGSESFLKKYPINTVEGLLMTNDFFTEEAAKIIAGIERSAGFNVSSDKFKALKIIAAKTKRENAADLSNSVLARINAYLDACAEALGKNKTKIAAAVGEYISANVPRFQKYGGDLMGIISMGRQLRTIDKLASEYLEI
jgi:hypothetical protein